MPSLDAGRTERKLTFTVARGDRSIVFGLHVRVQTSCGVEATGTTDNDGVIKLPGVDATCGLRLFFEVPGLSYRFDDDDDDLVILSLNGRLSIRVIEGDGRPLSGATVTGGAGNGLMVVTCADECCDELSEAEKRSCSSEVTAARNDYTSGLELLPFEPAGPTRMRPVKPGRDTLTGSRARRWRS